LVTRFAEGLGGTNLYAATGQDFLDVSGQFAITAWLAVWGLIIESHERFVNPVHCIALSACLL
jgi:hypothetical protein